MNYLSGLIMSGKDSNIFADIQKGIVYLLKDNDIFNGVRQIRICGGIVCVWMDSDCL